MASMYDVYITYSYSFTACIGVYEINCPCSFPGVPLSTPDVEICLIYRPITL